MNKRAESCVCSRPSIEKCRLCSKFVCGNCEYFTTVPVCMDCYDKMPEWSIAQSEVVCAVSEDCGAKRLRKAFTKARHRILVFIHMPFKKKTVVDICMDVNDMKRNIKKRLEEDKEMIIKFVCIRGRKIVTVDRKLKWKKSEGKAQTTSA